MPTRKLGVNNTDRYVVNAIYGQITHEDGTTPVYIGTIPEGSHILRVTSATSEAFDGSGNNVIDVGILTDADEFAADIDPSSAAGIDTGTVLAEGIDTADNYHVYATYDGSAATTGKAMIVVEYVVKL